MSVSSKVLRTLRLKSPHYNSVTKTFHEPRTSLDSLCKHCKTMGSDSRHHRGLCRRMVRKITGKNKK